MSVSPGARLGPYEVLGPLGAGAMGQVYRARDTRLDREVALKVLPTELADHPGRRERFEREARAISALHHPHICAVYDVGEQDGLAFLVMEYLEGETLAHRLLRGPIPVQQAIQCATEIADALDHAHRAGIVHRDLKPSNVMLTGSGTKLLDFGLAKVCEDVAPHALSTELLPKAALTNAGTILGTVEYMAPEQLEGRRADGRTDIFALGALMYEMATGQRAFQAESQAGVIAAILQCDPRPMPASGSTAPGFEHVLARCLAKDPDQRWQTARDLRLELSWVSKPLWTSASAPKNATGGSYLRTHLGRPVAWMWIALAGISMIVASVVMWGGKSSARSGVIRVSISLPSGAAIVPHEVRTDLAISPDGRQLAFVATIDGQTRLWVRSLSVAEAHPLPGTEGAHSPFWSPDGRFIGFATDGRIQKTDPGGGPPSLIWEATLEGTPSWGQDGTILFARSLDGIYRVSADGRAATQVTKVEHSRREVSHLWPHFLPDGRHFLYVAIARAPDDHSLVRTVRVASIAGGEQQTLLTADSRVEYASPGYLLYVRDATLLAHRFNARTLQLVGEPVSLVDGVHYFMSAANAGFSASQAGVLSFHNGTPTSQLVWFDRLGNEVSTLGASGVYGSLRIAPQGKHVAVEIMNSRSGTSDLWIHDVVRNTSSRLTSDPGSEADPVWSPDGRHIVFRSDRDGPPDLHQIEASGLGSERMLLGHPGVQRPTDWSSKDLLTYTEEDRSTGHSLWMLPLVGDKPPRPFLRTRFQEGAATFSPDGRWLAYVSDESGRPEVYVAPTTEETGKRRVSTAGGFAPRWRRDGTELFYVAPGGRLMSVPLTTGTRFEPGIPTQLFRVASVGFTRRIWYASYDVSADGQRFLVNVTDSSASPIGVILNWSELLTVPMPAR